MTSDWPTSDPQFLAAFGRAVRNRREALRIERKELAELADISYSYLSAIESGQRFPSTAVQGTLAEALGVEVATLLADANSPGIQAESAPFEHRIVRHDVAARTDFGSVAYSPNPRSLASPETEPSVSGATAELSALLGQMSGEDRSIVLSMARRLAGERSSADDPQRFRERRFRYAAGRELRTESYLRFWTRYLEELVRRRLSWAEGRSPEPRSYFTTPAPISGTTLSASFARNQVLRHELYINRGSRDANLSLLYELRQQRAELEKAYGSSLEFEDPGRERRAVRIAEYRPGHIRNVDEHSEYIDWFIDRGTRMRRALEAIGYSE